MNIILKIETIAAICSEAHIVYSHVYFKGKIAKIINIFLFKRKHELHMISYYSFPFNPRHPPQTTVALDLMRPITLTFQLCQITSFVRP